MISKYLQIKNFLTVGQNNFGNKIPYFHFPSQDLFSVFYFNFHSFFLIWNHCHKERPSFGHSDPDPSSVRSDFMIIFFQTMSGNETIAYYCLDIFKRAKVTLMNNYTLSILLQTAFTTGYVISAFIMNHVPRRIQFMSSALFMAVSTATLGFTLNQSVEVCTIFLDGRDFLTFSNIEFCENYLQP